jgi:hypothetical protein
VVLGVLLVGPPLVIVQGTPREHDWPWLLLVGVGLAAVAAGVPFAVQAWTGRFPVMATRAERLGTARWFWPVCALAAVAVLAFGGRDAAVSTLVPAGVGVALSAWRGRKGRSEPR